MAYVWGILAFLFFVFGLIMFIGIINPNLFNKKLKEGQRPLTRKVAMFSWILCSILFFVFVGIASSKDRPTPTKEAVASIAPTISPTPAPTPVLTEADKKEARIKLIESQFSVWDGSHDGLTDYIKKNMNDPKSYDHDETTYRDDGDYLTVRTVFRGKNAFGGVVKNVVIAKVSLDGQVLEIVSQN